MSNIQQLRTEIQAKAKACKDLMASTEGKTWTEENQKDYDTYMQEIDNLKSQVKRIEALHDSLREEQLDDQLMTAANRQSHTPRARELLTKFLRNGERGLTPQEWAEVRSGVNNTMSTGTGSQGGYVVQTEVVPMIMDALKQYGGVRQVATVIQTEQGNPLNWPNSDGTSEVGELVAENAAVASADTSFGSSSLATYKFSSKVLAIPVELLLDSAVDLVAFINQRLATRLGRTTNTYFTTGTGSSQPKGVVTAAGAGKVGASGQTGTVIYDDLVALLHSVDPAYRNPVCCRWMMNDDSVRVIRQLKDSYGRPLFAPEDSGLADDFQGRMLGYDIVTNQQMATMAASAKSILFGDFSKYIIRDVMWAAFHRFEDSAYAQNGQVGFLMFTRHGGNFVDVGNSLKYYQNAAS